jgi:hypothetical protein
MEAGAPGWQVVAEMVKGIQREKAGNSMGSAKLFEVH